MSTECETMQQRPLGGSGRSITTIGLGTNYVGGHNIYVGVDEEEGVRLVQHAVDLGVNFIDTADVYGTGRSEELVGKALAGRRDEVVVATKGGILFGEGRSGVDNSPAYLRSALHASLKRLGMDHVDLYYIHRPDGVTPPEEAFGTLMKFKEEGLIRAGGVSNFSLPELQRAARGGRVDALQSQYNLLQRDVEAEILPYCASHDIAFVPWGPLAYGLLGGRYDRDYVLPENDWRRRSGAFNEDGTPRDMDVVEGLRRLSGEWSIPMSHLALSWLLSRPAVASVIAGAKTGAQVEDNVSCAAVSLDADQIACIAALVA
jgi:aryl-alcohol dehydrogenase-like predicted oxidoreductase